MARPDPAGRLAPGLPGCLLLLVLLVVSALVATVVSSVVAQVLPAGWPFRWRFLGSAAALTAVLFTGQVWVLRELHRGPG